LLKYHDPAIAERAPQGKVIKQMLLDGELDAAILGDVKEEGPLKHLFPDHEAAGRAWAKTHGGVPINHLMVIRKAIADERPDVVREVYRVLKEAVPPRDRSMNRGSSIRCASASRASGNRWRPSSATRWSRS